MTRSERAWLRAAAVLAAVVLLDQGTKALVRSGIEPGETRDLVWFVDLVHVRNDGVAFGQLAGAGAVVIVIVAAALIALIAYFVRNVDRPLAWAPTGLLLGGAIGNAIDRARFGAVTDFIKLPHWPAFNVADCAITIGVVMLVYVIERGDAADR